MFSFEEHYNEVCNAKLSKKVLFYRIYVHDDVFNLFNMFGSLETFLV